MKFNCMIFIFLRFHQTPSIFSVNAKIFNKQVAQLVDVENLHDKGIKTLGSIERYKRLIVFGLGGGLVILHFYPDIYNNN